MLPRQNLVYLLLIHAELRVILNGNQENILHYLDDPTRFLCTVIVFENTMSMEPQLLHNSKVGSVVVTWWGFRYF